jgi:membrane-bound metal-dependent hydrolase YbcI (DUF457 family)
MITRHHVVLVILCTLILCGALVPSDPVLITVICLGSLVGAIPPDIQMKKPQGVQIRTLAWVITRFSSIICTPVICWSYHALSGRPFHPGDKRLTHSIPGILFLGTCFAAFLLLPASVIVNSNAWYLSTALFCGVMLGLVLHLVEDLCTRKGITPLFPFSTARISGSIRPCDTIDRRIAQFHFYHCSVAGIVIGFQFLGIWQGASSVPVCLFGLGSCLGMMIWSSDVSISSEHIIRDWAAEIISPLQLDPLIVQENPGRSSSRLMMGVYYFNKNK